MCLPLIPLAIVAGVAAAGSATAVGVGAANAAAAQETQAEKAMRLQREMFQQQQRNYNQQRNDMAPWLNAGQTTLRDLVGQMQGGGFNTSIRPEDIANDPGYQFRMAEGQKALERSASARGLLNSGGALKSLGRYSQGLASDEYQNAFGRSQSENMNRFNRMASVAGMGQGAANSMGNFAAQNSANAGQYANNQSNLYGAIGNAQAAGAMGTANAVSDGFKAVGSAATMGMGGYGGMTGGMGGSGAAIPPQASSALSATGGRSTLAGFSGPYAYDPNRGF